MKKLAIGLVLYGLGFLSATGLAEKRINEAVQIYHRKGHKEGYHQCNLFWADLLLAKGILDTNSAANLRAASAATLKMP